MFTNGQLNRLQLRKAGLLRQISDQRATLSAEAEKLRPVADMVDLGITIAGRIRNGLTALQPILSLFGTRGQAQFGPAGKFGAACSIARSLTDLWKAWR
jgi:hypothetical protein